MDTILLLSIFLVFITALVGGYLQRRRRDKVLADLQDFHAVTRMRDNSKIWGRIEVYANGLELLYAKPFQNHRGNLTTSYIMFRNSIEQVLAIYRFHTELSPENQQRRWKEIEQTRNPGAFRIALRHTGNFLNTFRDAINESMGMLLTRMKGTSSMSMLQSQDERLKKFGTEALGAVGNAYDPIMERHIGKQVVVELQTGADDKEEYTGLLREYSQAWLSVFDCRINEETRLPLGDELRLSLQRDLDFWIKLERSEDAPSGLSLSLRLESFSEQVIRCKKIVGEGYCYTLNTEIRKGETREWVLNDIPETLLAVVNRDSLPVEGMLIAPERRAGEKMVTQDIEQHLPDLFLVMESERQVDVFLPRTSAVLRHASSPVRVEY